MAIERKLHFIWLPPGPDNSDLPQDVADNIRSWSGKLPTIPIMVWGPDELRSALSDVGGLDAWSHIEKCNFPAMQSDVARLALVCKFGGVYSDLKNKCFLKIPDWVFNLDDAFFAEHPPTIENYTGVISNCLIGAPAGHPFVKDCLLRVCSNIDAKRGDTVIGVTGAGAMSAVIFHRKKSGVEDYQMLPGEMVWRGADAGEKGWLKRTGASYNGGAMIDHWSKLQKTQSLFAG